MVVRRAGRVRPSSARPRTTPGRRFPGPRRAARPGRRSRQSGSRIRSVRPPRRMTDCKREPRRALALGADGGTPATARGRRSAGSFRPASSSRPLARRRRARRAAPPCGRRSRTPRRAGARHRSSRRRERAADAAPRTAAPPRRRAGWRSARRAQGSRLRPRARGRSPPAIFRCGSGSGCACRDRCRRRARPARRARALRAAS